MSAKCPKCDRVITKVEAELITVLSTPNNWKGVAYVCSYCRSAISVQIDPIAIKSDTSNVTVSRVNSAFETWGLALKRKLVTVEEKIDSIVEDVTQIKRKLN